MSKRVIDAIAYTICVTMIIVLVCTTIISVIFTVYFEGYTTLGLALREYINYTIPLGIFIAGINYHTRTKVLHRNNFILVSMMLGILLWYIYRH